MRIVYYFLFLVIISGLSIVYFIFFSTQKGESLLSYFLNRDNYIGEKKDPILLNLYSVVSWSIKGGIENKDFRKDNDLSNKREKRENIISWTIDWFKDKELDSTNNNLYVNIRENKYKENKKILNNDFIESILPKEYNIFTGLDYKVFYNSRWFYVVFFNKDYSCNKLLKYIFYDDVKLVEIDDKKIIMQNTLPGKKICFFNISKYFWRIVYMYVFWDKYSYFVVVDKKLYYDLKPYFQKVFK